MTAISSALKMSLVAAAAWAWPGIAAACAVCSAGRDEENQVAFLLSTLFMSVMPLAAIGGIVFFLWRRIQKLEAANEAEESGRLPRPVQAQSR